MSRPISITIRLPVETLKTQSGVIASCQSLDISCAGDSIGDALNDLAGLLTRHVEVCFERGRFDQLFHGNGYAALEAYSGARDGRFLDIELKLGLPRHARAMQEQTHNLPSSLLSTWMT
jgi:hypothetical protein